MKIGSLVNALALLCVAGTAVAATAQPANERLVKDIPLQSFFQASHPWQAKIYQPGGKYADIGNQPVRVCLVGILGNPKPYTVCTALFGGTPVDGRAFPMQSFRDASLQLLPGPDGRQRPALVVRATFSGGGSGWLQGVYVWNYDSRLGIFQKTFVSVAGGGGQQEFVNHGPLKGAFVRVDQVYEGDEPNMATPTRYEMNVYEPAPMGYVRVLSLLTKKRYPNYRTERNLPDPIATLTPIMSRALKAVYPGGVAALER
ncbi:MAG: hypothetical protein JSR56_01775 [Proteobacteria bacterium]|nr:hypothetical protein [Pseudomonadota bacterium]